MVSDEDGLPRRLQYLMGGDNPWDQEVQGKIEEERGAMGWDKEAAYDAEVYALMAQVIEVCKKNEIPFVFSAQLTEDGEEGPLMCTSAWLPVGSALSLRQAEAVLRPRPVMSAMMVVRKEAGDEG